MVVLCINSTQTNVEIVLKVGQIIKMLTSVV